MFCVIAYSVYAITDSTAIASDSTFAKVDSTTKPIDTVLLKKYTAIATYTSAITADPKTKWYDIEQEQKQRNDTWIFFVLVLLLIALTYLKLAFSNDFNDQFRSFVNSNVAAQMVRVSKDDIAFSSVLMNLVFIVTMSLFTRFALIHFTTTSSLHHEFSIAAIFFLFTFFIIGKYAITKYIGVAFDINDVMTEYLFNLSGITKTIGISMIPILFVLYASPPLYFIFVFVIGVLVLCIGAVMVVMRGLSTSYKMMYKDLYHFLIYICVCEILPIFLFIKLLTKTAI